MDLFDVRWHSWLAHATRTVISHAKTRFQIFLLDPRDPLSPLTRNERYFKDVRPSSSECSNRTNISRGFGRRMEGRTESEKRSGRLRMGMEKEWAIQIALVPFAVARGMERGAGTTRSSSSSADSSAATLRGKDHEVRFCLTVSSVRPRC